MKSVNKYYELLVLLVIHFANHVLNYSFPFLLLYAYVDLGLNYVDVGLLSTVFIIVMTIFSIPVGYFVDLSSRIRYLMIFFGLFIMSISWIFISSATSFNELVIYFAILGLGASGYHPPASTIITELFEEDKAKALSANMITGMVGSALSPLIFAGLVNIFGDWGNASLATGVMGLVVLAIGFVASLYIGIFTMKNNDDDRNVVTPSNERGNLRFLFTPLIIISILFISLRTAIFRISTLFTGLIYDNYLNLSEDNATIASAIVLGVATLFIVVGGFISDNYKPRTAIMISSIGLFLSSFALVYFVDFSNIYRFSFIYFSINATFYIGSPAMSAMLADKVKPEERGKLFGSLFSFGQIIAMFVPIIFGYLRETFGIFRAFNFILLLSLVALFAGIYIFISDRRK